MGIIQRLRYILLTELSNKKSVVAVGSPAARSSPVLPPSECTKQSMQQFLPRLPTNFPRHFLFLHNRKQRGTVLLSALLKAIPSTNPSSLTTKLSDLCHPDTFPTLSLRYPRATGPLLSKESAALRHKPVLPQLAASEIETKAPVASDRRLTWIAQSAQATGSAVCSLIRGRSK